MKIFTLRKVNFCLDLPSAAQKNPGMVSGADNFYAVWRQQCRALTLQDAAALPPEKLQQVREEIGDVLIYLTRLADKLGIDVLAAAFMKAEKNRIKYPTDKAKGSANKYTEL